MAYPYIIQGSNIVVVIGTVSHTINKSHLAYDRIKEAIKTADWDTVKDLVEPRKMVVKYGAGFVRIEGDQFLWKGKPMHSALSNKMIEMLKEGFDITPLVFFMENLMENPSKRAITELYGFLEACNLPITPDGHFLAYKKVRDNYFDCHSGTMDNSVGKVLSMERGEVDDNKETTCSTGLHFCSISYLAHFGGARTVIVKINPRDVVSIPVDYNNAKGRACRYEVIGELEVAPEKAFTKAVQETAVGSQPVPKAVPKAAVEGTGPFSQGYTAGYCATAYQAHLFLNRQRKAYQDGFARGQADRKAAKAEAYRFVGKPAQVAGQQYDKNGNPLSMTKDAIRKREARARAKAARMAAGRVVSTTQARQPVGKTSTSPMSGFWPKPKGF